MVRLYHSEAQKDKIIQLSRDQLRHLRVLRLKPHEPISVFDGKGHEFLGSYEGKVSDGRLKLYEEIEPAKEPKIRITLATAFPKGSRAELMIEKATELGVNEIIPLITQRSVVKPKEEKTERLEAHVIEASAQSKRAVVPIVRKPTKYKDLLAKVSDYDEAYICNVEGTPFKDEDLTGKNVLIIIGPEGDFTEQELEEAKKAGIKKVRLATTTLRVETAAITAVAQLIGKHL